MSHDLFIFDVNGVLDNQWKYKKAVLSALFQSSDDRLINQVLVGIERNYETNHTLSFKECLKLTLAQMHISTPSEKLLQVIVDDFDQSNGFDKEVVETAYLGLTIVGLIPGEWEV